MNQPQSKNREQTEGRTSICAKYWQKNFLYRGHRNWGITHFITGGLVASKKVFNHNLWRSDSRSLLRTESCEWSQLAIPPNPSLSLWFPSILSTLSNFQNVFFQIAKRICPNWTFYLCFEWSQLTIPLNASLPLWFLTKHSSRVIMFPLQYCSAESSFSIFNTFFSRVAIFNMLSHQLSSGRALFSIICLLTTFTKVLGKQRHFQNFMITN